MYGTTVHNLKHERMEEGDVYIGRAGQGLDGYFGNPFHSGSREENIAAFAAYATARMTTNPEYRRRVKGLIGKRLFCFCAPLPCHGDVLATLAEE